MVRLLGLVLILLGTATPLAGQTWTPQQQQLIEFAEGCWATYNTENWEAYADACPADERMRYWEMTESVPSYGHGTWRRWGEAMWPRMDGFHHELRPISIQIFDDVALIYFFATYSNEDQARNVSTFLRNELAVLQRRGDRWVLLGGATLTSPVP